MSSKKAKFKLEIPNKYFLLNSKIINALNNLARDKQLKLIQTVYHNKIHLATVDKLKIDLLSSPDYYIITVKFKKAKHINRILREKPRSLSIEFEVPGEIIGSTKQYKNITSMFITTNIRYTPEVEDDPDMIPVLENPDEFHVDDALLNLIAENQI